MRSDEGDEAGGVVVDEDLCLGTGTCEMLAPDVFRVGEEGIAEVVGLVGAHAEAARLAVLRCPAGALSERRGSGGEPGEGR